jgi:hypothetical protein
MSEMRPRSARDRHIGSKFGNQAKPVNYSEKSIISYQFWADVRTYGHRPWHTADNDAAETDLCTQNARLLLAQRYEQ